MSQYFNKTPILQLAGFGPRACNVTFKLENLQPSGSFKIRGISHMVTAIAARGNLKKLICSSGGNAGLAVATVGHHMQIPVDVFVPLTTKPLMIKKLESMGAAVFIGGENWNAADAVARREVNEDEGRYYIPPYDDALLWDGHASMIEEIKDDGIKPDVVLLSVGGGGLLCGVQRGLERVGWNDVQIVAVETQGAASFAAAKAEGRPVMIPTIESIATSLGARSVTMGVFESSVETKSFIVSDAASVSGCLWLLNEHRFLVEPACGASVAALLDTKIWELIPEHAQNILVIICGGSNVNFDLLAQWKNDFNL